MKLSAIIYKVRCYGFGGVADYLLRLPRMRSLGRLLRQTRDFRDGGTRRGITLIGEFSASTSIAKVARDLALRLKECGIPFQAVDSCAKPRIPASEYAGLLTPEDEFDINRYSSVVQMCACHVQSDARKTAHSVYFWEFESGLEHLYPSIAGDSLLAMSDFDESVFRRLAPPSVKRVSKLLYPLRPLPEYDEDAPAVRRRFGIPEKAFAVHFNFDFRSSYFRKNPEGVMRAFAQAFPNDEGAVLVFKMMRSRQSPGLFARMTALVDELNLRGRFVGIDEFLPHDDLISLANACDAYISLHRGEGLGLTLAEAMQLSKPVIATDYSSTTEFCTGDNAMLIPYQLVPVPTEQVDLPEYRFVRQWAEPDIGAAASALRELRDNPSLRKELGARAAAFIRDHFSDENFRRSVSRLLDEAPS